MSDLKESSERQLLFLVVEDDESTAEMLKDALLPEFSCVVSWASTGLEAFQRVRLEGAVFSRWSGANTPGVSISVTTCFHRASIPK